MFFKEKIKYHLYVNQLLAGRLFYCRHGSGYLWERLERNIAGFRPIFGDKTLLLHECLAGCKEICR